LPSTNSGKKFNLHLPLFFLKKEFCMKKICIVLTFLAVLVLGGCFSPWEGDDASVSITIDGRGRTILSWDPEQNDSENLVHTITLTGGPGPDVIREGIKAGQTVQFAVAPGDWDITVNAYLKGVLKAYGFENKNLKRGHNDPVRITMGPPPDGSSYPSTFAITMQNDGNGTAIAEPARAAQGQEVEITAVPIKDYSFESWEVVSGDVTLNNEANPAMFTMPGNAVTIKAIFKQIPPDTPHIIFQQLPTFDPVTFGYTTQPSARDVTITNNGSDIANITSIVLDSEGDKAFTLSNTPNIMDIGATATFKIQPRIGLAAGTHTGTIIVTYDSGEKAQAMVSFKVTLGSGTEDDPFLVYDAVALERVGRNYIDLGGRWSSDAYYIQKADIDLVTRGISQIGLTTGSYDGGNYEIANITRSLFVSIGNGGTVKNCKVTGTVSGTSQVGGVVQVNRGGTVKNCHFTGTVSGNGPILGGVVGENQPNGMVENCSFTGTVSGSSQVGGVVGVNIGTVENCHATENVSGNGGAIGGVVGENRPNGMVKNCNFTGIVLGVNDLGGVVGSNGGTVENCYATGNVNYTGTGSGFGGVVGRNIGIGTVENCYATSDVSGSAQVGGVVGANGNNGGSNNSTVKNCYATGNVLAGSTIVGGVVGANMSTVENCYATCDVSGIGPMLGGVVGQNIGTVENCYATGDVSGQQGQVGGVVGNNVGGVENCYATGTVSGSNSVGGVVGNDIGTVKNCVAMNKNIKSSNIIGRVVASNSNYPNSLTNNYGLDSVKRNDVSSGSGWTWGNEVSNKDGKNIYDNEWNTTIYNTTWWTGTAKFGADVWFIVDNKLPTLKNMPDETNNPQTPTIKP
jgi:hypothetical protein